MMISLPAPRRRPRANVSMLLWFSPNLCQAPVLENAEAIHFQLVRSDGILNRPRQLDHLSVDQNTDFAITAVSRGRPRVRFRRRLHLPLAVQLHMLQRFRKVVHKSRVGVTQPDLTPVRVVVVEADDL
jgi:hypothetical protein